MCSCREKPVAVPSAFRALAVVLIALMVVAPAVASCGDGTVDPGEDCDDGSSNNGTANSCCTDACTFSGKNPDLIVGDLSGTTRYNAVNGITAYAVATTSCNLGSCWLNWIANTPDHPVIGQNMFRLNNGRFEQIGQSWLKHGYNALHGNVCSNSCIQPPDGTHLGVNCSDIYLASENGTQSSMGPKDNVDPDTGVFPYPDSAINTTGNSIFKRLQVHNTDLDPGLNAGALYFVEGQYVAHDDATARANVNNASYRPVTVGASPYSLTLTGSTQRQKAGIQAWKATDPSVTETIVAAPEGEFIVSAEATSLGGGIYHYEYAVQNLTNNRAGRSFTVPLPPGSVVSNVGFHDVDYHSGSPFDGTDWASTASSGSLSWSTSTYDANPLANALRWGTLYNFRFDANQPPGTASIVIGLFRPGTPSSVAVNTVAPAPCAGLSNGAACNDGNACTTGDTCQSGACVPGTGVTCTPSDSCVVGTCDVATGNCSYQAKADGSACNDGNPCTAGDACTGGTCSGTQLSLPAEVDNGVRVTNSAGTAAISWNAASGSSGSDVLRGLVGGLPVGPGGGDETCLASSIASNSTLDSQTPSPGAAFWYIVKGTNACGAGPFGSALQSGAAIPRQSTTCN